MISGIPTQTLFNPYENYPPGVLRSAVIQLPGSGDTLDIQFFPECQEIVFATDNRTSDTVSLREERLGKWTTARIDRAEDSWSLDEISSEKTKWKDRKLQVEWDRNKCELMKSDIAKIEEILEWQDRDLLNMELGAEELIQRIPENEEMDEWLDVHTFTEEEEEFFENEIASMNLHHLRASSGPPTGDYYMRVSYDKDTGLPTEGGQCWRTEEWCPEMGRLSLISLSEDYGGFSSFNGDFVEFGIHWPDHINEKTEGECGERRFSGLKSCGGWIEEQVDNEGRFVANGLVQKVGHGLTKGAIIRTEYGDCDLQHEEVLKHELAEGMEIKILCKDNDILKDWAKPIKCLKVLLTGEGSCNEVAVYKM